jgi:hypothetical protein
MKKIIILFGFTLIMTSLFNISLSEFANAEQLSSLNAKLKIYFSKKIPNANITTVKVIKIGDVVSATRQEFLTDNIKEDLERPVLVHIKGKCKYSDKIIDENVEEVLHKDKWGEWAIGQGTQTKNSIVGGILTAVMGSDRCPENPNVVKQRVMEKENAEEAIKSAAKRRVAIVSEIKKIAESLPEKEEIIFDKVILPIYTTENLHRMYDNADTLLDDVELKKYNSLSSEEQLIALLQSLKGYNWNEIKSTLERKKAMILEIETIESQISTSEWNHLYATKYSKNNDILSLCHDYNCIQNKNSMKALYSYAEDFDPNNLFKREDDKELKNVYGLRCFYQTSEDGLNALLGILKEYKK